MKERNWHLNNMEIITSETADRIGYGYIRALAWAMIYVLKWIGRHEAKERERILDEQYR